LPLLPPVVLPPLPEDELVVAEPESDPELAPELDEDVVPLLVLPQADIASTAATPKSFRIVVPPKDQA